MSSQVPVYAAAVSTPTASVIRAVPTSAASNDWRLIAIASTVGARAVARAGADGRLINGRRMTTMPPRIRKAARAMTHQRGRPMLAARAAVIDAAHEPLTFASVSVPLSPAEHSPRLRGRPSAAPEAFDRPPERRQHLRRERVLAQRRGARRLPAERRPDDGGAAPGPFRILRRDDEPEPDLQPAGVLEDQTG